MYPDNFNVTFCHLCQIVAIYLCHHHPGYDSTKNHPYPKCPPAVTAPSARNNTELRLTAFFAFARDGADVVELFQSLHTYTSENTKEQHSSHPKDYPPLLSYFTNYLQIRFSFLSTKLFRFDRNNTSLFRSTRSKSFWIFLAWFFQPNRAEDWQFECPFSFFQNITTFLLNYSKIRKKNLIFNYFISGINIKGWIFVI